MFVLPAIGAAIAGAGASIAGGSAVLSGIAAVGGLGLTAASLPKGSPKIPGASNASAPSAPSPTDSLAAAQATAADRVRMIAASGGQTTYAGLGNTSINSGSIQMKTLLGS